MSGFLGNLLAASGLFLTTCWGEVYSYGRSAFSVMSASSEFEPHPSFARMRVRRWFAVPVAGRDWRLVVRAGEEIVLGGGLFGLFSGEGVRAG